MLYPKGGESDAELSSEQLLYMWKIDPGGYTYEIWYTGIYDNVSFEWRNFVENRNCDSGSRVTDFLPQAP